MARPTELRLRDEHVWQIRIDACQFFVKLADSVIPVQIQVQLASDHLWFKPDQTASNRFRLRPIARDRNPRGDQQVMNVLDRITIACDLRQNLVEQLRVRRREHRERSCEFSIDVRIPRGKRVAEPNSQRVEFAFKGRKVRSPNIRFQSGHDTRRRHNISQRQLHQPSRVVLHRRRLLPFQNHDSDFQRVSGRGG